jgi:hypothetical protein
MILHRNGISREYNEDISSHHNIDVNLLYENYLV